MKLGAELEAQLAHSNRELQVQILKIHSVRASFGFISTAQYLMHKDADPPIQVRIWPNISFLISFDIQIERDKVREAVLDKEHLTKNNAASHEALKIALDKLQNLTNDLAKTKDELHEANIKLDRYSCSSELPIQYQTVVAENEKMARELEVYRQKMEAALQARPKKKIEAATKKKSRGCYAEELQLAAEEQARPKYLRLLFRSMCFICPFNRN